MNQVIRRVKGFFQLGERDALSQIDELAGLGEKSLHLMIKILTNSPNGLSDIETCTNEISSLEKKGDKIVQSLEETFGKGSISAILMREFERLADSVDSVLDRAHALSRQIRRVTKRPLREAKEFDAIIRKDQVRLIEIGLVQLQDLRKLFSIAGSDMQQSLELAKQIERLEEQGDDVKDNMLDEIYGSWEVLDYASFHNYIETTIEADDILDRCEDASDLVIAILKGLGA
ncbi:MAG TPA: DUF47 family protein [Candidatus Bathyarchaeia archaeon]|nr:DUF47 family protein [Candidatus Bathyarchaeia archaeon]